MILKSYNLFTHLTKYEKVKLPKQSAYNWDWLYCASLNETNGYSGLKKEITNIKDIYFENKFIIAMFEQLSLKPELGVETAALCSKPATGGILSYTNHFRRFDLGFQEEFAYST